MAIDEEVLKELMQPKADIEKISTISSDGKTLITRIPKEIREELDIEKGNRIRWLVKNKEINLEIIKHEKKSKKNN